MQPVPRPEVEFAQVRVVRRVRAAIDRALVGADGRPIVAVAHFGAILTHLGLAGGLAPQAALAHKIDTLSVTHLARGADGWRIGRVNHRP